MHNKYYLKPPTDDLRRVKRYITEEISSIRSRPRNHSFMANDNASLDQKIHFDISILKTMINKKKSSLLQESFEIDEEFIRDKDE